MGDLGEEDVSGHPVGRPVRISVGYPWNFGGLDRPNVLKVHQNTKAQGPWDSTEEWGG